jgi:hypothetical protein
MMTYAPAPSTQPMTPHEKLSVTQFPITKTAASTFPQYVFPRFSSTVAISPRLCRCEFRQKRGSPEQFGEQNACHFQGARIVRLRDRFGKLAFRHCSNGFKTT